MANDVANEREMHKRTLVRDRIVTECFDEAPDVTNKGCNPF